MFGARHGGWHSTPIWRDFLPLPLCPDTFTLCPPKVLHSVCGVPAFGCHHISVCQSVNLKMCVHVICMHTHVCIFLAPSWVRTSLLALSPISYNCSVPQSERGDTLGCPLHLGCRARAILTLRTVSLLLGFTESGSRLGGDGSWDCNGRVRGRLPFESLESIL